MSGVDFAGFLEGVREMEQLAVHAGDVRWLERYARPTARVDTVLWLGCNILRTPHIAVEVVALLEALGESFVAVAGGQFCCAAMHDRAGDPKAAERMMGATAARLESLGAVRVVTWCPTCHVRLERLWEKRGMPGLSVAHAGAFLAERVGRFPFRQAVATRVALHVHTGAAQRDADAEAALRLLRGVPGVEVVGTFGSPELDSHCSPTVLRSYGAERFQLLREGVVAEARALGADTLAMPYHSCHREWCQGAGEGLAVRNFVSLVAEAVGCDRRDYYQEYRRLRDPGAIAGLGRANWESHGLTEERARRAAERFGA